MAHPHASGHPGGHPHEGKGGRPGGDTDPFKVPRLVAWETTRACNLACAHCRAAAIDDPDPDQLTHEEGIKLIDQIAEMGPDIILILTGGEPLMRPDIFELASHGTAKGLRVVMAPNGTLLTAENAKKIKACGIDRISLSLDGATPEEHDDFRGVPGAFARTLQGIEYAKAAGLEFQFNTTVTRRNLGQIDEIQQMADKLGAVAHHIFLLVPTGRGRALTDEIISAQEYEDVLKWFYKQNDKVHMELKATCAPHYHRVLREQAKIDGRKVDMATFGLSAVSKGCLGGQGFVFVSHTGRVQPCGYLDLDCGQLREKDFGDIYRDSQIFCDLRSKEKYEGKCGVCEYYNVCGGCRARAYEATGNYMAEEPLCMYEPKKAG